MPENEVPVLESPAIGQPQELTTEDLMRFAFQENLPKQLKVEPIVAEVPVENASEVLEAPSETIVDDTVYLKEHFGYEDRLKLKADLEELSQLRQKPATAAETAWANEESKKIAAALNSGKFTEVRKYLEAQETLSNLDNMSEEQQLKLYIKMQNPLFDQELIEDEYGELYKIKNEEEFADDPLKLRREKVRLAQRRDNDITKAKEYFSQYKNKIQLPDIQSQQAQPIVDEDYEQYKASTAKNAESYNSEIVPKINSLKDSDLQTSLKVIDPNSSINFDISLAIDKTDFDQAKNEALNFGDFMQKTFYENGAFKGDKLVKAIARIQNFDKYVQSAARQAVMAERKRLIEKETPAPTTQRENVVQGQESEIDRHYKMAMSV